MASTSPKPFFYTAAGLIACGLLVPVWLVKYPPLLDYPNHLARTFVLAHLKDPTYHFGAFYSADWGPYPYLGMDVVLVSLQKFLSAETAGKVFLSLCVITVPLSVWWFVREANPGHDGLALWGLLLAYSTFFLEGFVNFQLGLTFCLITVGLWLRYIKHPLKKKYLAVLVVATLAYFIHLIAFVLTGFIIVVYTAAACRRFREICSAAALFFPGVLVYFLSGTAQYSGGELYFRGWPEKLLDALSSLQHGYSPRLETFTLVAIAVTAIVGWLGNSEFHVQRPWLWVFVGLLLLYCALPDEVGESWDIDVRVIPLLFAVLLVLAQVGRRQRIMGMVALTLFFFSLANVARNFLEKQVELSGMQLAVQQLPLNTRLLPLINENDDEDPLQRLYVHFWAYSIIERGASAPYLFDLRGQTALRTTEKVYIPERPLKSPLNWEAIRNDYDYIWVYDFSDWGAELMAVGKIKYAAGDLQLYQVTRTTSR